MEASVQANGETLKAVKQAFLKDRSFDNLGTVLMCLHNAYVLVPCETDVDENTVAAMAEGKTAPGEVRFKPDIIEDNDGKKFFPVFSVSGEVPESYGRDFILCEDSFAHCVYMAEHTEGAEGLVLDPYTEPMVLPMSLARSIYRKDKGPLGA